MLSLLTSCSKGLDQPRDCSPSQGMDLAHVDDLTAFGGVYSWVSATEQIAVLSSAVRRRQFRHNELVVVMRIHFGC